MFTEWAADCRLLLQDDKQYALIMEVIKNDSLRQIEREK